MIPPGRASAATARPVSRARQTLAGVRGKAVEADAVVALLEALIEPGDRVCLEGATTRSRPTSSRARSRRCRPSACTTCTWCSRCCRCRSTSICSSCGIASKLDFSFSGPQSQRLAQLLGQGKLQIGAIHTYLELFGRYFIDLTPKVSLIAAQSADAHGNLYTGPNTEDTPAIVEATAFKSGIVVAQVDEIVDALPRVDIPGRLGRFRRARAAARIHRAAVHARPGADLRDPGADGDDGHQGHLRRVRRAVAQPRHRLRHRGHRAAAADLRRAPRPEGKDLPPLGAQSASRR